jgi:hypothetical protein
MNITLQDSAPIPPLHGCDEAGPRQARGDSPGSEIADADDSSAHDAFPGRERLMRALDGRLRSGSRLLELGCGSGDNLRYLRHRLFDCLRFKPVWRPWPWESTL